MKKNPNHLRLAYMLVGLLFFSTGMLYYFVPRGILPYSRTLARLSLPQKEAASLPWDFYQTHFHKAKAGGSVYVIPPSIKTVDHFYKVHAARVQETSHGQASVPRLFMVSIPPDIRTLKRPHTKRELFIKMVLPLVLQANERVLAERARLLAIDYRRRQGLPTRAADRAFLQTLCSNYRMPAMSIPGLLRRVDVVPPSLALAQAILETGCGSSCAALTKRSIFGHMATLTEVASFPSLMESVRAYILNLNRHKAYESFRTIRFELREKGQRPRGLSLAKGLLKYSIRKEKYIQDLQGLICRYNLEQFDGASLEPQRMCS